MKKIQLLVIVITTVPLLLDAQAFCNLDFEYGVYKAQPRKWSIEGEGVSYTAQLDSMVHHTGLKSLSVNLKSAEIFIFISIPKSVIAGKEIHAEAHFRSSDSDSLQAMLIFYDPNNGAPITSQPNNADISDWQVILHRASFSPDYSSDRLLVALMATGTGQFWFDNVDIKISGQEYGKDLPDFGEPTTKEIHALDRSVAPILFSDPKLNNGDLISLTKIVRNATVVALGENSHGSSPIYKLKLRMIKYLVENEGFSVFALESPTVEGDRINDYVLSGKGSLEQVINDLVYPSWQTQEMVDIIQWMRSYNKNAKTKIQFRGFDMQNGSSALKAVGDFAKVNDPALLNDRQSLDSLYDIVTKGDEQWKLIAKKSENIIAYLTSKQYEDVDPVTRLTIAHYMNIFHQSLPSKYKSHKAESRDEYMADNINWIINNSGVNVKIIVSADNTHITKASGKMGNFLNDRYGDKYLAFGFTYNTGSYAAYGPEKYYEVHPSFPGTYEYYFSKSMSKNFLLDLRETAGIDILNKASGFRSIGSRPQETNQFNEINLKKHFDVIVYLEKSVHTESVVK